MPTVQVSAYLLPTCHNAGGRAVAPVPSCRALKIRVNAHPAPWEEPFHCCFPIQEGHQPDKTSATPWGLSEGWGEALLKIPEIQDFGAEQLIAATFEQS